MTRSEIESAIAAIEDQHVTYLLEALSKHAGFFSTEGKLLYIATDNSNYPSEGTDTEYLCLQTHVRITAVENNPTFEDGYYNIIVFKGSLSDSNLNSFLDLCTIHAKKAEELEFKEFFYSLIALFQLPTEQQYLNALGLYGELKYMEYVYQKYGKDISINWHKNGSFSRYDFTNGQSCIEIKTTTPTRPTVELKHKQVFGQTYCVLVVILCEELETGETISEVINRLQSNYGAFNSVNFNINLAKETKRVSPHDLNELRLSLADVLLFDPNEINPFPEIPEEVSQLTYRLDYSDLPIMSDAMESDLISKY
jgi:hypothetical protein